MKKFITKLLIMTIALVVADMFFIFAVPKDNNSFYNEYRHKIQLLDDVSQPRVIIVGGSSVAFGTDSRRIKDSLNINVINFGLHAGLGIKYPLEDCLEYVKNGDIVILQMEYENYYGGGDGGSDCLLPFMIQNEWRKADMLNFHQWRNIVMGMKQMTVANFYRIMNYYSTKSFNKKPSDITFEYTMSGFNEYGDEVSHLKYPSENIYIPLVKEEKTVDEDFIVWLDNIIGKYELAGAKVYIMPPACIKSQFYTSYNECICNALSQINQSFITEPDNNAFDDSCAFDTGYHMNKTGVSLNTNNIIKALKEIL